MARPSAAIRWTVVCAVFGVVWLAAAPAQAGVGDLVDGPVGGAVGGTVDAAREAVPTPVRDAAVDAVDRVTRDPDDVVRDVVRTATGSPAPDPHRTTGDAGDAATGAGATPRPAPPPAPDPSPQRDPATPTGDTPSTGSPGPAVRHTAHVERPLRERSVVTTVSRAPTQAVHRPAVTERATPPAAAPAPAQVADACESGSLAPRDLRRCARATTTLPGLGGVPMVLPPAGLAMVVAGLVLVARGRRRRTAHAAVG